MPEPQEDFVLGNGLGLELQEQRPLNESYFCHSEPELPLKLIQTHPTQRTQSQQMTKDPSYPRNSKRTSMSKGKAPERARTRSSVKIEDLVQQFISQKDEAKESRRLLHIAFENLEVLQKRAIAAEETRKDESARGTRIAQNALGVQEKAIKARQDAEAYRLQLEKKEREIQRQQELIRTIEAERDLAEKEAEKARDVARQLNDERLISLARQEGRKLGFLEGMKRGRRLVIAERNQAPSTAFIEEFDEDDQARQTPRAWLNTSLAEAVHRKQAADAARREREAVEAARKEREAAEVARKEREAAEVARKGREAAEVVRKEREEAARRGQEEAVRKQLEVARTQFEAAARRELEAARQETEQQVRREVEEKERIRQLEALEAERQRERVHAEERELERQRIHEKEVELEREKEAVRQQEATRALEMEAIRKRQAEKEKELEAERERERQLEEERNNERRQREEREAELAREREKVRELELEREMSSVSSVSQRSQPKRLGYLPMPEPPPFVIPRSGPSTSKPLTPAGAQSPLLRIPPPNPRARSHIRRTSQSSQETSFSGSGSTSLNNLDIVSFPSAVVMPTRIGSHLSVIPEVASDIGRSPAPSVGPGQGNEQSPVEGQSGQMRPVQTRKMDDVERWVQSTAASELNTPTEPATPPVPPLSWPNRSPHGSSVASGSISSGTIPIEVQPPSRPTSIISPTQEDVMLLSPNSRPLQLGSNPSTQVQPTQLLSPRSPFQYQRRLESEQPGFTPVIPDMLDGDEGIQLMNFGTPGFVPISIVKTNTSEGRSGSGSNIYAQARPSSRISNIYAPPTSGIAPQQMSTHTSNIVTGPTPTPSASGIPTLIPSSPRVPTSIYASSSPRTVLFVPPPTSQSMSSVHMPAPGSDRSGSVPVIPPPPQRQIYSPNVNAGGPVISSSSANGYPYPVSPGSRSGGLPGVGGATPRSYTTSLPGPGMEMNTRTPGGSVAPLPTMAGWGAATATPRSRIGSLPRGNATPHAQPMALGEEDEDEDEEDDHDLVTRMNTEANRSGRGGMTLQIPPMNY
ncbi:Reticulocyte-binding protein 2 like protein [Termitomyces sp. J132]|nr:Reticulocyte-binding protein 2 like protein [Termitomyces sp. J132]